MKIVRAVLSPFALPLCQPLTTAHGVVDRREGILLALELEGSGSTGWGEASPLPAFGTESGSHCLCALERLARLALGRELRDLDLLLDEAESIAADEPAARAAFDMALSDLAARCEGYSLSEWLARRAAAGRVAEPDATGGRAAHGSATSPAAAVSFADVPRKELEVGALISGEGAEQVAERGARALRHGYRTLKLKVGSRALESDLKRVAALRRALGPTPRIRLDANGAWDEAEALRASEALVPLGIELLEQPVAPDALAAMARVRAASSIPIAADESAMGPSQLESVIRVSAADLLVLKPAAVGGLRCAERMARRANQAGLEVVVTSFLDSALGRLAATHLAACLAPKRASGVATGALLECDLSTAARPRAGSVRLPDGPGLGVAPKPDVLARLRTSAPLEFGA